jgi:hypothetical protein
MSMGSGCCGGDCGCGPCSEKAMSGLGDSIHPMLAHAASPMHMMRGIGQTSTTGNILTGLEAQLSTLWNDLQQTKIAGIGLGFILVGVVVAFHFKKR